MKCQGRAKSLGFVFGAIRDTGKMLYKLLQGIVLPVPGQWGKQTWLLIY